MPTLNSERTLPTALGSLAAQDIDAEMIEILVVDGGSTDTTREIAVDCGARVLENPRTLPEFGKLEGLKAARGRYIMFLDSDESLARTDALRAKLRALQEHPNVRNVVTAGSKLAGDRDGLSDYANRFGDPFSFFMYGMDGGDYIGAMRERYRVTCDDEVVVAHFSDSDIVPICDAGAHLFDRAFLTELADISDVGTIPIIFPLMASKTRALIAIEGDHTIHHAHQRWSSFRRKLRWRVIANMHRSTGGEGFASREHLHPRWFAAKKILFVLYAASIVFPLLDAISLALEHGDAGYFVHFRATLYTFGAMSKQYARKLLGRPQALPEYG